MREIILEKIAEFKKQEHNFELPKWDTFFIGWAHISDFMFKGAPDCFLLDYYDAMMHWHYEFTYTGEIPDTSYLAPLPSKAESKENSIRIYGYGKTANSGREIQVMGRINRSGQPIKL